MLRQHRQFAVYRGLIAAQWKRRQVTSVLVQRVILVHADRHAPAQHEVADRRCFAVKQVASGQLGGQRLLECYRELPS